MKSFLLAISLYRRRYETSICVEEHPQRQLTWTKSLDSSPRSSEQVLKKWPIARERLTAALAALGSSSNSAPETSIFPRLRIHAAMINRICRHLRPGGHLFIGHSESLAGLSVPLTQTAPAVYVRHSDANDAGSSWQ